MVASIFFQSWVAHCNIYRNYKGLTTEKKFRVGGKNWWTTKWWMHAERNFQGIKFIKTRDYVEILPNFERELLQESLEIALFMRN